MDLMRAMTIAAVAVASLAYSPAVAADGAKLFGTRCAACHWDPAKAGEKARPGPSMKGVVGRMAGTGDFKRYSKAMKGSGVVWNAKTLDAYLENPRTAVKGTTMAFPGLRKADERAAVVKYLMAHGK